MKWPYKEDLLQFIWQHQLLKNQALMSTKGSAIRVIKTGVLNTSSGPDFLNAHIIIDGIELHGSIEIHLDSKDWYYHKHHLDQAYNNVVLHVCYSCDVDVLSEDKTTIASVQISEWIDDRLLNRYNELLQNAKFVPCSNQLKNVPDFTITTWMERLGVERLEHRSSEVADVLENANGNWSEALYTFLLQAFGKPKNDVCFKELAERIPFSLLSKHSNSIFQLEALLLGASGFLGKPKDNYSIALRAEYSFLAKKYSLHNIESLWMLGKVRPSSQPTLRIAQFAAIVHKNPRLIDPEFLVKNIDQFYAALSVTPSEYWQTHYTLNKESVKRDKPLTKSFINLLLINALIPFLFFYSKKKLGTSGNEPAEVLLKLPAEKNSIISKWNDIGLNSNNSFETQALLYLYKQYCSAKRCLSCNIGKQLLLKNG